jgi:protein-L-isoaspartate(D-aspartate) O-methyltransferase
MASRELSEMVNYLINVGYLKTDKVKQAMLSVDRKFFVPADEYRLAYSDSALPIGYGQTISAPGVVAFMLEKLDVKHGMKILEVGTGSGYNCALLSSLAGKSGKVISVDVVPKLIDNAKENMKNAGLETGNWELVTGDGSAGYPSQAPFDRIIVTAAMPHFSSEHPLAKQLTENGKLIAPVGSKWYQDLILYHKKTGKMEKVLPVIFVPLIGKFGFGRKD